MNTSMDSLSIEIESVAKDSNTAVDLLITKLNTLRESLQKVLKESENFSKLSTNISNAGKSISTKTPTKNVNEKLTYSQQLANLGIENDPMESSFGKLTKSVDSTNSALREYLINGEKVTVRGKVMNGEFNAMSVSVENAGKNVSKLSGLLPTLTSEFTKTIAKGVIAYRLLSKIGKVIGEWIREAANYEESLNLFNVTLGENADQAKKWVETFSDALYLDPSSVMQYMGQFNSLTKGLGVGADKAYIMSKNLTQLTYDLASFKNLSFDTAFRKLQSAMSGEIEPLRNVGVALSQATLQELAFSLGIEKNVADMSEAEKAQLRYIQILRSTSEWQTDMGRTLISPANSLRILKQQFTLLARAMGSVFIPVLMEVIPYVMVLTQALTKLAQRVADFFGYKLQDIDYSRISTDIGGIADGIEDIGDSADSTAKKLNTMLAPFDKLNVVQNQLDKSGKGSGSDLGGAGLDLPLPEYDALANLNDQLTKKMDEAKQKLKSFLPIIATIGGAFAAWKIGKTIADFMTWWDKLSGGGKTAARIGLSVSLIVLGLGLTFDGNKKVLDEKTLLRGVAEQIGGAALIGGGAGLLTKSVPLGIFVGLSLLGFSASKTASHGDWKNGITGFFEQGISVAGIAGLAFKLSGGNPYITLGVTALVTWAEVLFDLGELAELKPTWEELYNAIFVELNPFHDLGVSLGDFVYDFGDAMVDIHDGITDFFTNAGNAVGDFVSDVPKKWDELKTKASKKWDEIKTDASTKWNDTKKSISDSAENTKTTVSNKWDEMKTKASDTWTNIKTNASDKWDSMKTKATNTWTNIKTGASNKWNEIKTNTNTKWDEIKKGFSTKLDGMKNATSEKFSNIKTTITNKWASAKTWLQNNIGSKDHWKNKFKGILNGASDILSSLKTKFSSWKATLRLPHISWSRDGISTSGTLRKILETLNLPTTLPRLSVSWYAEGGFPKDGEFFVANENGPEMIGRIGNRSAVANNDQIEASLTNALLTALNNYDFGGGKGPTTIYIGNKKVYEGYGDYINSENDRYGTNTIRI